MNFVSFKGIINYFTVLLSIYCTSIVAQESQKTIDILAGLVKPPFIVEENGDGIQLELIREALRLSNINVRFIHAPIARHRDSYRFLELDGIAILEENSDMDDISLSLPYITYENVAITLKANNIEVRDIMDLTGKKVSAFQNAHRFLGDDYAYAVADARGYHEFADQYKQLRTLFENKTEIVIADVNIYRFLKKELKGRIYEKTVAIHHIFAKRDYVAGFRDELIRDKFVRGIEELRTTGRYQEIIESYSD